MYTILHNIDEEKITNLKGDRELVDFVNKIRIENEDYDFSILGVSDAEEYLEDFCPNLTLIDGMLTNEQIADALLSDMQSYKENIREILIGRLMDSSSQRTYWDAWFRGATGKDLEDADKGIIYNK